MLRILLLLLLTILASSRISHEQYLLRRHLLNLAFNSRTDTLYNRCPTPRIKFYDSQRNESQSYARRKTAEAIGLNGDQLIHSLLVDNQSSVTQQIRKSLQGVIMYFIFMIIGLVTMLIVSPILICCLCNPYKCPPCISLRNLPNEGYSSFQIKWPAILTIVLSFVVVGASAAMLINNGALQDGYSDTRCSVAILFDDLLNGNFTRDSKNYWLGLKPLQANLSNIVSSAENLLSDVQSFEDAGKLFNLLVDQIKLIKHDISDIPRGDGSAQKLQFHYISPINSSENYHQTIQSTFVDVLGTQQQEASLIGSLYTSLSDAQHALSLNDFLGGGLPKLSQNIVSLFQKYAQLVTVVEDLDVETDRQLTSGQNIAISPIKIIIYVMSILSIVSSITLIVAAIFICHCNKFSIRKIIYPSCFIVSVAGIFIFIISLVLSATTMVTHYSCQYIDIGLQTKAQFKYRFGPIFNNTLLTEMMAQCATQQGSGIIINKNFVNQALNSFHQQNNPEDSNKLSSINPNQIIFLLNNSKTNLTQVIRSYRYAQQPDINSNQDLEILLKISNSNNYQCSSPGFEADSWIPTINQQNLYIPCKNSTMNKVTTSVCLSKQQFQLRQIPECTGCIDTFDIFSSYTSKQEVLTTLKLRYSSSDCTAFNEQLANVWNNFYRKKQLTLNPVEQRARAASQKIDNLADIIKAYEKSSHNIKHTQLTSTSPLQQTITQLDCKVLGQDARLITNTFCTQVFNYSFIMRILSITMSFALLLLMIFSALLAYRAFRSSRVRGYSQEPLSGGLDHQGYPVYLANSQAIQVVQNGRNENTNNKQLKYQYTH